MTARRSCVAVWVRKKVFGSGSVNHFFGFWSVRWAVLFWFWKTMCGFGLAIQTTLPFWIFLKSFIKYFLLFLVFRTRKSCQKSHFGIKMQLSEPKTDFSSYKAKSMARSPSRRVRDPERHQTVSARRAASKMCVQKFWNRVLKTSNRETAPEAPKPS